MLCLCYDPRPTTWSALTRRKCQVILYRITGRAGSLAAKWMIRSRYVHVCLAICSASQHSVPDIFSRLYRFRHKSVPKTRRRSKQRVELCRESGRTQLSNDVAAHSAGTVTQIMPLLRMRTQLMGIRTRLASLKSCWVMA